MWCSLFFMALLPRSFSRIRPGVRPSRGCSNSNIPLHSCGRTPDSRSNPSLNIGAEADASAVAHLERNSSARVPACLPPSPVQSMDCYALWFQHTHTLYTYTNRHTHTHTHTHVYTHTHTRTRTRTYVYTHAHTNT